MTEDPCALSEPDLDLLAASPPLPEFIAFRPLSSSAERDAERLRELAPRCAYSSRRLAEMLRISQRQLQRRFQRSFGYGPQRWLREERLEAARRMLNEASSVKEVVYSLGFRRPSQFCRDFREHFGVTPSSCMKRCEWPALTGALRHPPEKTSRLPGVVPAEIPW